MTKWHEATYIHAYASTKTTVICQDCDWVWHGDNTDGQDIKAHHNHQKEEGIIF